MSNKNKIIDAIVKKAQMFDYSKAPKTPWGKADSVKKIENGVTWFGTPGHGGLGIARGVAMKKLTPQARELGEQWGSSYWYEEDVAWVIPMYENYDWFKKMQQNGGGKMVSRNEMEEKIKHYWPEYFDKAFSDKAKDKHERVQAMPELQVGDKITLKGKVPSEFLITEVRPNDYTGQAGMNYRIPKSTVKKYLSEIIRDNKSLWKREASKKADLSKADTKELQELMTKAKIDHIEAKRRMNILMDIVNLSSGTMAKLTGKRGYQELEEAQNNLVDYAKKGLSVYGGQWKNWNDVWEDFKLNKRN